MKRKTKTLNTTKQKSHGSAAMGLTTKKKASSLTSGLKIKKTRTTKIK